MRFPYAARTLRKNPGFTITAVVTLALGIGASTAIFSVVNAVLLRPLPYADPGSLVIVTSDLTARNVNDFQFPAADIKDMRDEGNLFAGLAALQTGKQPVVDDDGHVEEIRAALVTPNLFTLLGTHMTAGRAFTEEDGAPEAPPPGGPAPVVAGVTPAGARVPEMVILSYGYWQRRFGGDRGAIGKFIPLGDVRAQIVGVLAPGFELLMPPRFNIERTPDLYGAARIDFGTASRINVQYRLIGRLKPGVSVGAAQSQMDNIANDLKRRFPIKMTAGLRFRVVPMHQEMVADVQPAILALMGGVTFVLLIACANVANLLLVRTSRRERELAVRAALGGSRTRLVRQMLSEALLLALGGSLLGVGLAALGVRLLVAIGPASLPAIGPVAIDPFVLGFTTVAGLLAAAAFGVIPALRASRPDLVQALRASGRTSELGAGRALRNGVVTTEVALAFVLLVGSGLMLRSFVTLSRSNPGFEPDGVLTFQTQNLRLRTPEERLAFIQLFQQRVSGLPGVTGVTAGLPVPFGGQDANARWGTDVAVNDPSAFQQADLNIVLPGYLRVMRMKLIAGRAFTEADNVPTSTVVLIDRVLAAKAFPGHSAVGKRLYVRYRSNDPEWVDVVGVVEQERRYTPASDGREQIFVTNGQLGHTLAVTWMVRTAGDPARLESSVRSLIAGMDNSVFIGEMKPLSDYVDAARAPTRFALVLIGTFAAIALVLAAVGLYGVLSTIVRQRTAEIGVRMAFGAPKARIFRQMIGEGMRLSVVGVVLGVLSAFALTRAMKSMLVGVAPTDPATFVAIALLFLAIAALSCWLPARRAAALDPANALREE